MVLLVTANGFADLQAAATAMACCAKTDYKCAGLNAPDDCCQRMGHTAGGATAGTLSSAGPSLAPAVAIVLPFIVDLTSAYAHLDSAPAFKRPHDPPHLHPYSLLI